MFKGATSFNGDISKWDVSSVNNMQNMFRNARSFKRNLCGARWVHSNAIKTTMFLGSLGSISGQSCPNNLAASRKVCTRTKPAFLQRNLNVGPGDYRIESKNDLKRQIDQLLERSPKGDCIYCPGGAIGDWDVSRVTDMSGLFSGANSFDGDISKWDVSRVTNMGRMFMGASSFNRDLSKWDVSSVTDMTNMFKDATAFKGDISKWDVANVQYMTGMFDGATAFEDVRVCVRACVCVCVCVCLCLCLCLCVCVSDFMCACLPACLSICMYLFIWFMYACCMYAYVCMYICMYVCMYVDTRMQMGPERQSVS